MPSRERSGRRDLPVHVAHGIESGISTGFRAADWPHEGGMNTKLCAVTGADARPPGFFMAAGQVGDGIIAAALLGDRCSLIAARMSLA